MNYCAAGLEILISDEVASDSKLYTKTPANSFSLKQKLWSIEI